MSEPRSRQHVPDDGRLSTCPGALSPEAPDAPPRGRGLLFAWGAVGGLLGAFLGFVPDLLAGDFRVAAGLGWLLGGAAAGLLTGEFLDQREARRRHLG